MKFRSIVLRSTAVCLIACGGALAQTTFSATGVDASAIQTEVDAFRTALGANNGASLGSSLTGRREINWDGVPDADAAAGRFPDDFFNVISPRGAVFVLGDSGTGFQVSADSVNPASTAVAFENLNVTYSTAFAPFSTERLFTPLGTNVTEVHFYIAGSTTPATTRAFGAVFTDVDSALSSKIEFFRGKELLGEFAVPATAGDASLSFLGVDFTDNIVTHVRITAGTMSVGADDVTQGSLDDIVVMDDFIYGEPVVRTASLSGLAGGLDALRDLIDAEVLDVDLRKKLMKSLNQAVKSIDKAITEDAADDDKAVKGHLNAAIKSLGQFDKDLDKKNTAGTLDADLRLELAECAAGLGVDMATLFPVAIS